MGKLFIKAFSVLEVIISTIIILIVFLLFSFLLGQLFTTRNTTLETRTLFKIKPAINIDTTGGNILLTKRVQTIGTFSFKQVIITDKNTKLPLLQYDIIAEQADSLFQ